MKISFLGAARTVTGSQHLLEINGSRLLLECGLFQGHRKDFYTRNQTFHFDPRTVDALILSHAHIDHSGNLPNLVKQGFEAPIFATGATVRLSDVMLRDSAHIQEADAEYLNQKHARRGEPPVQPLYTITDAERVMPLFRPVYYDRCFEPIPGVEARLVEAGHILGSAAVALDIEEKGRKFRVWFSGDIGRIGLPLLRDPALPDGAEYLIMECTYGDKPHANPQAAYDEFREVVSRTLARGGKVIIPAFAVGRTQELVYDLHQMIKAGDIPPIPVYVDSPLAVRATQVFKDCPEYFDDETNQFVRTGNQPALSFPGLHYVQSVEESKSLNERDDPMVIISASGMAEAGRILHHLRNNIEDKKNTILIVSWQAPHTLGRRLADREPVVRIFGEEYQLRAEVATIGGLSAHAGQKFLLEYAKATQPSLKSLYLVHGEEKSAKPFMGLLRENGFNRVGYPDYRDTVDL